MPARHPGRNFRKNGTERRYGAGGETSYQPCVPLLLHVIGASAPRLMHRLPLRDPPLLGIEAGQALLSIRACHTMGRLQFAASAGSVLSSARISRTAKASNRYTFGRD